MRTRLHVWLTHGLGAPGIAASAFGMYGAVVGQALRTLLLARFIGPSGFGLLNLANLGANLTPYSDLGTGYAGEQRASEARGRLQPRASDQELRGAAGARMFAATIVGLILIGFALSGAFGADMTPTLLFLAASAPLQSAWLSARGWLRVTGNFRNLMWSQLAQVVIWVTVVPILAIRWGVSGAFVGLALSYLPGIAVSLFVVPLSAIVTPSWPTFRALMSQGRALWAIQVASFIFVNIDQALIGAFLGTTEVGLYAIAMLVGNALTAFSDGAAAAGHVKTLEVVARTGRLHRDLPSVTKVMSTVELAFCVLVPLSWIAIGVLVKFFLPEYLQSTTVVPLVGVAMALLGIVTASNSALLSVGMHKRVPWLFLVAAGVKVALVLIVMRLGVGLVGVATASAASSLVYALMYLHLLGRAFGLEGRENALHCLDHLRGALVILALAILATWAAATYGLPGLFAASAAALLLSAAGGGFFYRSSASRPMSANPG